MRTLDASLVFHARTTPDAIALTDAGRETSYATLARDVSLLTDALARHGIGTGDRVAVIADKRVSTVVVLLATIRLGAIVVPINPRLVPVQTGYVLLDCGARLLFAAARTLTRLDEVIADCPVLECAVVASAEDDGEGVRGADRLRTSGLPHVDYEAFVGDARSADGKAVASIGTTSEGSTNTVTADAKRSIAADTPAHETAATPTNIDASAAEAAGVPNGDTPVAILYTSGSTARPKGVMLSASNLAHGAASVATYLGNHAGDRILALMPLSFDYGLSQITTALTVGARAVLFDPLLPKGVLEAVVRHRVTGLPAVPHLWNRLAALAWPPVEHLRYVTSTGGRLSVETIRRLEERLPGTDIVPMYGFTEAFRSTRLPPAEVARRPDSIGKAVPYADVLVVAPDGRECVSGEVGELIHGGPLVSLGYWNDEAATRAKIRPRFGDGSENERHVGARGAERFAWSGDLARRDEEGFLYFVSRREDLLKLHGYRVNPAEIEEVLMQAEPVRDVCVVGVPHPDLGQAAVALVVTGAADDGEHALATVSAHCRAELPSYMVPERILIVAELPANPNGKVNRTALHARYEGLFGESSDGASAQRPDRSISRDATVGDSVPRSSP